MTPTPVTPADIASGLRKLATLVEAGILEHATWPEVPLSIVRELDSESAVLNAAKTLGVQTTIRVINDAVHWTAPVRLDGVVFSPWRHVPLPNARMVDDSGSLRLAEAGAYLNRKAGA